MVSSNNSRSTSLKPRVIIAYTDNAAAGSRALLGVERSEFAPQDCFEVEELSDLRAACPVYLMDKPGDCSIDNKIVVLHHHQLELSLVIINVQLNSDVANFVANAVLDHLAESDVKEVTILSAHPSEVPSGCMSRIELNRDGQGLSEAAREHKISDPFLNTLLQFLMVEPIPTTLLLVSGHAAKEWTKPNMEDGSRQCIELFQETLRRECGLNFNTAQTMALEYRGCDSAEIDIRETMYI